MLNDVMKKPYAVLIIILILFIGCTNSSKSEETTDTHKEIVKKENPAKHQEIVIQENSSDVEGDKSVTALASKETTLPKTTPPVKTESPPQQIIQEPAEAAYKKTPEISDESSQSTIPEKVTEVASSEIIIDTSIINNAPSGNAEILATMKVAAKIKEKSQEPITKIVEEVLHEDTSENAKHFPIGEKSNPTTPIASPDSPNVYSLIPKKTAPITDPALFISRKTSPAKVFPDTKDKIIEATPLSKSMGSRSNNSEIIVAGSSTDKRVSPVKTTETSLLEQLNPEATYTIALLPLENLSEEGDALKHIIPVLTYHLNKKGLSVLNSEDVETFTCNERIRTTGLVTNDLALKLKNRFNIKAILTGTIVSFSADENPAFGILLRLIDSSSGSILWANYASATGDDFSGILGLGKIKSIHSLIPRVITKILSSLSTETLNSSTKSARKIAVLPFQNNSGFQNAGKIAMYMFINELLKNPNFEPIEYGNTRKQIVKARIRNRGELNYDNLSVLSNSLGTDAVILGIVDSYTHKTKTSTSPEVAITARLLDSSKSIIVWYNSHLLRGDEDVIALDWGKIKSVHKVAYSIIVKMVQEIGMARWPE